MDRRSDMAIFLAVVDHGSFSAAARALGQTPSAVGKRVGQLEDRLGADLLIRSTRRMTLTDAGRRYGDEAREILARIAALEDDIAEGSDALRGAIRMTAPTAYGQRFVVPALAAFMERHPGVEIDLLLTDKAMDLVGDGLDLALRTGAAPESSLIGRRLGPYRRIVCAAPDYLAAHGHPDGVGALTDHRCLRLPRERTLADWGLGRDARGSLRLGPGFVCNSLDALHTACVMGRGIACLPDFLSRPSLEAGTLRPALPGSLTDDDGDILILRPETTVTARRVRALIDFLSERLKP